MHTSKNTKFFLIGKPSEYFPGEQRAYRVQHDGTTIGTVEGTFIVGPVEGEPVAGFAFSTYNGTKRGTGRTRIAAVRDAYQEG